MEANESTSGGGFKKKLLYKTTFTFLSTRESKERSLSLRSKNNKTFKKYLLLNLFHPPTLSCCFCFYL